jgi:hypothetical protein
VDDACWVGNDIISADVALKMREAVSDATVVLIHHMSYIDYQCFKHVVAQAAIAKRDHQRAQFAQADRVFGVGPLLRDRLRDLLPSGSPEPGLIVPGLPDVTPRAAPSVFTACTFGRLDASTPRTIASNRADSRSRDSPRWSRAKGSQVGRRSLPGAHNCDWSASVSPVAKRSSG